MLRTFHNAVQILPRMLRPALLSVLLASTALAGLFSGAAPTAAAPAGAPTPQYNIRVQVVVVSDDDGGRKVAMTPDNAKAMFDGANVVFQDAGIKLVFDPAYDWTTLKSTTINNVACNSSDTPAMVDALKKETARYVGKIVYFMRWGPGAGTDSGCSGGPTTIDFVNWVILGYQNPAGAHLGTAHETGHFLDLPHTFAAQGNHAEIAAFLEANKSKGKNALDGDGFSDTPPDPAGGVWPSGVNCNGENSVDIGGYTFTPDVRNMMSYYFCPNSRFSAQQIQKMRQTLQHPLRKQLIEAPCMADFIGLPAGQIHSCIGYWIHRGLWPVTLSQYTAGGATYMAGSFQKGADRPVYVNMTQQDFNAKVESFKSAGWRPDQVSALGTANGPRYTAVWKKTEGQFITVTGMEENQYQREVQDMRAAGYVHQDVWVYKDGGKTKFGSTFVKRPVVDSLTRHGLTSSQYSQLWDTYTPQGFRTIRFQPYADGGQRRYVAIMEKLPGAWSHYRDMTPAKAQERYNQLVGQGFRIHQIHALDNTFSIIFTKP